MKKILFTAVLCLVALVGTAQSFVEERPVKEFSKVSVKSGIDVYITEGTSSTAKIETNIEEALDNVRLKQNGTELEISFDKKFRNYRNLKMKVYVSAKGLESIKASGGSDVFSTNTLTTDDIYIRVSGGSDASLSLKANNVHCKASGGSDIILKGDAGYAELEATGGSDIKMKEMTVKTVDARASGGSDIIVNVTEQLNAKASGGSDIIYSGEPRMVNKSGDVKKT